MTISSRTPEGSPNRCPICRAVVRIEPSRPLGDAPCPKCGAFLLFVLVDSEPRFFNPKDPRVVDRLAANLGINPEALKEGDIEKLRIDSLDSVDIFELVMELEEIEGEKRGEGL